MDKEVQDVESCCYALLPGVSCILISKVLSLGITFLLLASVFRTRIESVIKFLPQFF